MATDVGRAQQLQSPAHKRHHTTNTHTHLCPRTRPSLSAARVLLPARAPGPRRLLTASSERPAPERDDSGRTSTPLNTHLQRTHTHLTISGGEGHTPHRATRHTHAMRAPAITRTSLLLLPLLVPALALATSSSDLESTAGSRTAPHLRVAPPTPAAAPVAPRRPHIVSLFLDDHGWGDVGFNDPTVKETAHMDALAASGIVLTNMHSAASVCTPSRAGLMTGRFGARAGIAGNFGQTSLHGLAVGELTLANVLGSAGYATRFIGKHHLGHHKLYSPTYRGFAQWYGLPYSGDMGCIDATPQGCKPSYNRTVGQPACPALCPPDAGAETAAPGPNAGVAIPLYDSMSVNCSGHVSCDTDIVQAPYNPLTLNGQYVDRARQIIGQHARGGALDDTPLFLHVAFAHTHTPLGFAPAFTNSSSRPGWYRVFGDVLAEVDAAVGDIVAALEDAGLRNDTLIMLASDNGPADLASVACEAKGSPGPFVGAWQKSPSGGGGGSTAKTTTWQGGHHVMGAASWPSVIKPGRTSDALASTLDYMTTFASVAGASLPTDRVFDGVDLSPLFENNAAPGDGDSGTAYGHTTLFHPDNNGQFNAGRIGKYSVYWETYGAGPCRKPDGSHDPAGKRLQHSPPLAFDLSTDPAESTPVTLPPALLNQIEAARTATIHSVNATYHTTSSYATGGSAAWPCCNRDSSCCRCAHQQYGL